MKRFGKRIGAFLVGAAMLTTGTTVISSVFTTATLIAEAAGTITVNQELAIPTKNADGEVTNLDEVSYRDDVKNLATSGLKTIQLMSRYLRFHIMQVFQLIRLRGGKILPVLVTSAIHMQLSSHWYLM